MSVILSRLAGISLIHAALVGVSSALADTELTLAATERLALQHAPWLSHHRTNVTAAAERVTYSGRLPDPPLTLGEANVPTGTYRLNQEDMTMVNVGIRQAFPPGDTLKLRSQRARTGNREALAPPRREVRRLGPVRTQVAWSLSPINTVQPDKGDVP